MLLASKKILVASARSLESYAMTLVPHNKVPREFFDWLISSLSAHMQINHKIIDVNIP